MENMVVYVKNKLFSIRGNSYVRDEEGRSLFEVRGKFFSITNKKFIYDTEGKLIFIVRNQYWISLFKRALVYTADGELYCRLKERFFGRAVGVDRCSDDIRFESQGLFKPIRVIKNGVEVARMGAAYEGASDFLRDSYRLEVLEPSEEALLVALAIGVDSVRDSARFRNVQNH